MYALPIFRLAFLAMAHPGVPRADAPAEGDERAQGNEQWKQIPPMKASEHLRMSFLPAGRSGSRGLALLVAWLPLLQAPPFARVALANAPPDKGKPSRKQGQYQKHRDEVPQVKGSQHQRASFLSLLKVLPGPGRALPRSVPEHDSALADGSHRRSAVSHLKAS